MGPGLSASGSSQHEFGYSQTCSPMTLAQGLAWEDVAGSVSWGECQVQTPSGVRLGFLVWGVSHQHQIQVFYAQKPQNGIRHQIHLPTGLKSCRRRGEGQSPIFWGSLHVETGQPIPF